MIQTTIDFGRRNRDRGIKKAVDHANTVHHEWSEKAYAYLVEFVRSRKPGEKFMTEDIRNDAGTLVPEPPSLRSWGAVTVKALKKGLIKHTGEFRKVKNKNANCANAAVWMKA